MLDVPARQGERADDVDETVLAEVGMETSRRKRPWRNEVLRSRDVHDYSFVDWLYGPTALTPDQEPEMFKPL